METGVELFKTQYMYTPLNRITSGPGHFYPIKRNKGVGPANRN